MLVEPRWREVQALGKVREVLPASRHFLIALRHSGRQFQNRLVEPEARRVDCRVLLRSRSPAVVERARDEFARTRRVDVELFRFIEVDDTLSARGLRICRNTLRMPVAVPLLCHVVAKARPCTTA